MGTFARELLNLYNKVGLILVRYSGRELVGSNNDDATVKSGLYRGHEDIIQ